MISRLREYSLAGTRGRPWPREREGPAPTGVGGMSGAKVNSEIILSQTSTLPLYHLLASLKTIIRESYGHKWKLATKIDEENGDVSG